MNSPDETNVYQTTEPQNNAAAAVISHPLALQPSPPVAPIVAPRPRRPRRHASIACQQCQSRKKKCSGTSPCDSCLQRSLDCTYSGTDGRTQLFRRQKFEELHSDSELLRDFLGSIRSGDDGQLQGLVTTIRAPTTMKETKIALRWRLDEITATQDSTKHDGDDVGGPSEVIQQVNRSVLKITQLTDSSAQRSPSQPSSSWSDVVLR